MADSIYLKRFLEKKRESSVQPPPNQGENSAEYIREFFQNIVKVDLGGDDDSDFSDEDHGRLRKKSRHDDGTASYKKCNSSSNTVSISEGETIKIFNLPYTTRDDDLKNLLNKAGIAVKSSGVDFDRNKRSLGSATITLRSSIDLQRVIDTLNKVSCEGRPLRAVHQSKKGGGGSSSKDSRYFVADIALKCVNCGEIGHKTNDPMCEAKNPCHLCAGTDHEPATCPNIRCFNCNGFGHSKKDCQYERSYGRMCFCSNCADYDHVAKDCPDIESGDQVESSDIYCMVCLQKGHAMCKKLSIKSDTIYCPNCGLKGHHVDLYMKGKAECRPPRYDAYQKLPKLNQYLAEPMDTPVVELNNVYASVIRSSNLKNYNYDRMVRNFPSMPVNSSSNNHSRRDRDRDYSRNSYYEDEDGEVY